MTNPIFISSLYLLRERTDFTKTCPKLDAMRGHPNATVSYFIQTIMMIMMIIIIIIKERTRKLVLRK